MTATGRRSRNARRRVGSLAYSGNATIGNSNSTSSNNNNYYYNNSANGNCSNCHNNTSSGVRLIRAITRIVSEPPEEPTCEHSLPLFPCS